MFKKKEVMNRPMKIYKWCSGSYLYSTTTTLTFIVQGAATAKL